MTGKRCSVLQLTRISLSNISDTSCKRVNYYQRVKRRIKMPHATQKLKQKSTHSPSVQFRASSKEKYPMTNGFYINREWAANKLHIKDLDDVTEIEVTIRIK
jgi:hypothetical protein